MQTGQTSQTAQFVSILRAHHYLFAPSPKILDDSLAQKFCGLDSPEGVRAHVEGVIAMFSELSDPESAVTFVRRIEHSVCIRSRLLEERVKELRETGLKQLVFLGAGLDTTAYRASALLNGIDVFEVDHPDTQRHKRALLQEWDIDVPKNLRFGRLVSGSYSAKMRLCS